MRDIRWWTVWLAAALIAGCAPVTRLIDQEPPSAEVEQVRVTELDFAHAELAFDLKVHNPNPDALSLSGFDYRLDLDGAELLRGKRSEPVSLAPQGSTRVTVPLNLVFADIFSSFARLADADEVPYRVELGAFVDAPLLGQIRIPIRKEGTVPLVKPPRISLHGLRVQGLSPVGARLALELAVENPNTFFLQVERFDYRLALNGQNWLAGSSDAATRVEGKGRSVIKLPLTLDFSQLGGALGGGGAVDYKLEGAVDMATGNRLIGKVSLPLFASGSLAVAR